MDEYTLNKDLSEKEIKEEKIILESKPRKLAIILTTRCNLKCIMCPCTHFHQTHKIENTIPFDAIKQIYKFFPYIEWIDWQGGEVFLVDYFKELFIEASKFPRILQDIITNGLLIDEEWAEILVQSNVLLTYSIDAVTKNKYEYIRRGARFENLLKSIETINRNKQKYNSKIKLLLNAVVMKCNYRELDLFPEFCKKYAFSHLRFDYLRHDVACEEDIFTNPQDSTIRYIKDKLSEIELKCKEFGIYFTHSLDSLLSRENDKQDRNPIPFIPKCKAPWRKLTIEDSGGVRIDCKCPYTVGNIIESPIEEIWNSEMIQRYRSAIIAGQVQNLCSEVCLNNAVEKQFFEGI